MLQRYRGFGCEERALNRAGAPFAFALAKERGGIYCKVIPVLDDIAHRPYPPPDRPWRLAQRWNDLLFAHWPLAPAELAPHLPAALEPDTHDGAAWLGVIPFWMDRVRVRAVGGRTVSIPGTRRFSELNLRTYVRSRATGKRGVYFFSLDASSPLAVLGARILFHLPYFPATMTRRPRPNGEVEYASRRWLPRGRPAEVCVRYRPVGKLQRSQPGELAAFLTEQYALFTLSPSGRLLVGEIHHRHWPLQPAEAEFTRNDLPADFGFTLPQVPPVLHFARELEVYLWSLRPEVAQ